MVCDPVLVVFLASGEEDQGEIQHAEGKHVQRAPLPKVKGESCRNTKFWASLGALLQEAHELCLSGTAADGAGIEFLQQDGGPVGYLPCRGTLQIASQCCCAAARVCAQIPSSPERVDAQVSWGGEVLVSHDDQIALFDSLCDA